MSSAFNLFLNDVVTNKSVHFSIKKQEPFGTLHPMEYEELSDDAKKTIEKIQS